MIEPLEELDLGVGPLPDGWSRQHYNAVLFSIGYEQRATHVARQLSGQSELIGFTFPDQRVLSFEANLAWAGAHGRVCDVTEEARYGKGLAEELARVADAHRASDPILRVLVDISSMTRQRIADTFRALHASTEGNVVVDWVYSPATISGVALQEPPMIVVNAAMRGFEGWSDPTMPVTCVVGAGFEGDVALGVIDDLEPDGVWVFLPRGYSQEHDKDIEARNAGLLAAVDADRVLDYRVDQPLETLLRLDALVGAHVGSHRAALVPLGPKMFALLCVIVGAAAPANVTVWRVSAEATAEPIDRRASGDIIGLTVTTTREL